MEFEAASTLEVCNAASRSSTALWLACNQANIGEDTHDAWVTKSAVEGFLAEEPLPGLGTLRRLLEDAQGADNQEVQLGGHAVTMGDQIGSYAEAAEPMDDAAKSAAGTVGGADVMSMCWVPQEWTAGYEYPSADGIHSNWDPTACMAYGYESDGDYGYWDGCGDITDNGFDESYGDFWPPRNRPYTRSSGLSHSEVPKRWNLEAWSKQHTVDDASVTTLMIRNVPNRYDRVMLMQELDELGFRGAYDFLYLPIDNATHWNVGYAFVNFDLPEDAKRCMSKMQGHQFKRCRQRRVAQISIAHIQGLENNLAHCSGTTLFSVKPWLRPWVRQWAEQEQTPGGCVGLADCHAFGGMISPVLALISMGAMSDDEVAVATFSELVAAGARRIKVAGVEDGAAKGILPPRLRSALRKIAEHPELADIDVELVSTAGKSLFWTTPWVSIEDSQDGVCRGISRGCKDVGKCEKDCCAFGEFYFRPAMCPPVV